MICSSVSEIEFLLINKLILVQRLNIYGRSPI